MKKYHIYMAHVGCPELGVKKRTKYQDTKYLAKVDYNHEDGWLRIIVAENLSECIEKWLDTADIEALSVEDLFKLALELRGASDVNGLGEIKVFYHEFSRRIPGHSMEKFEEKEVFKAVIY